MMKAGDRLEESALKDQLNSIGLRMAHGFEKAAAERRQVELRWLTDLRQYKGIYDPDVLSRIKKGRSRTFVRMTRKKANTVTARMMDMLFPGNRDKNWEVKPSPNTRNSMPMTEVVEAFIAEKQQEKLAGFMAQLEQELGPEQITPEHEAQAQQLAQLTDEELEQAINDAADEACDKMEAEISDQLSQIAYREECEKVIRSGNLYGTGILKAPLVQERKEHFYQVGESGAWESGQRSVMLPFVENTSIWNYYPDPEATEIDDCEIHYELHVLSRSQLMNLGRTEGFDSEAVMQYVADVPGGNYEQRSFETELRASTRDDSGTPSQTNRYQVIEAWASLSSEEMMLAGISDVAPESGEWVNVWILDGLIIRSEVAPLAGRDHPYNIYYFDKDETSFWGSGMAEIMRDDQIGLNSVTRACMDNAATTVGPMYDVYVPSLVAGEDAESIFAGRIFRRKGDPSQPVVRTIQADARISDFLALRQVFSDQIHENTTPSYMHGDVDNGVGSTVGGLSMLMGSANIDIKDQVRNFDDGITRPAIAGIYAWNMEFNDNPDIKGDYQVNARGSSSLVAKEVRVQNLNAALSNSNNPEDSFILDRRLMWDEWAKASDLGEIEIVRDEKDYEQMKALQQQVDALTQQLQSAQKAAPGLFNE